MLTDNMLMDNIYQLIDAVSRMSVKEVFTKLGDEAFKIFLRDKFEDKLYEYGFFDFMLELGNDIKANDGLINIYRMIHYPLTHKFKIYNYIKNYENIGVYWTWQKGAEQVYFHNAEEGEEGTAEVSLYAKVRPEGVNWVYTFYVNAYNLSEEKEIRIKDNNIVQVYAVKMSPYEQVDITDEMRMYGFDKLEGAKQREYMNYLKQIKNSDKTIGLNPPVFLRA